MRSNGAGQALAVRETSHELATDGMEDFRERPTALQAITAAEMDTQIATAKRFPRSASRFLAEAKSMIAISPEVAAQCRYELTRAGKKIEGPSVRLAEIAAACYGNLRVTQRITDDDGTMVTAQATGIDLERNVGYLVEVKRRVTDKNGRRFSDDMVIVTCNAAMSIAGRNATFKVIPRAFVTVLEDEARAMARGDVKSLPDRLDRALAWFAGKGVPEARVLAALGVGGRADVTLDHLMTLQGMRTALQDGQATIEEVFPIEVAAGLPVAPLAGSKAEQLAAKLGAGPEALKERQPGEEG